MTRQWFAAPPGNHRAAGGHRPAHRHGAEGRQRQQRVRGALRPPQHRQIQPLPGRGQEAAAPATPPGSLVVGDDHRAVRCAPSGQQLAVVIGGVHGGQHVDGSGILSQSSPHQRLVQPVAAAEPVAQARAGFDVIPLPAEGLHRLPHRRPADAQGLAQALTGDECPARLGQNAIYLCVCHCHTAFPQWSYFTTLARRCKHFCARLLTIRPPGAIL